jgi:pimeloyl-ACP methyl ester carboxylesterase
MAAVLFVHGAGGGGWEWNIWARVFAANGCLVRAPDLQPVPGGLTQTRLADYSDQVAAHLGALRRELVAGPDTLVGGKRGKNVQKIVLVGASLGGLLALMNAEHADALILVNPIPPAPVNGRLPERDAYPAIIPWGANASLESTRRALPDADEATCLYAFRRWRDESGAVMNSAQAGVVVARPNCPVLMIASEHDADIPVTISAGLAHAYGAELRVVPDASHVGPLLGRTANCVAESAVAWLNSSVFKN